MLALLSGVPGDGSENGMSTTEGGRSEVPALDRRVGGGGGGADLICEDVVLSAMLGAYDESPSSVSERAEAAVLLRERDGTTGLEARI
jgi:hypothetical protein